MPTPEPLLPPHRAIEQQEARLKTLLDDLKKQSLPMHLAMLAYLMRRPDYALSSTTLARWTGYKTTTAAKNPPTLLVKLKLLQRHRSGQYWEYTAKQTDKELCRLFPDLDIDMVTKRLLAICPG